MGLATLAVLFLVFSLRPADLLSLSLPPPRKVEIVLARVGTSGTEPIGERTVEGAEAQALSRIVHGMRAVPIGTQRPCAPSPEGQLLYELVFAYPGGGTRSLYENGCDQWLIGGRLWQGDADLRRALASLLPRPRR